MRTMERPALHEHDRLHDRQALDGEQRRRVLVALIAMVKKGYIERRGKYHEYEYRNLTPVNTEGLNDEGLFVAKGAEQASRKVKYGVNNG